MISRVSTAPPQVRKRTIGWRARVTVAAVIAMVSLFSSPHDDTKVATVAAVVAATRTRIGLPRQLLSIVISTRSCLDISLCF
jgi:hypothetical protein